MTASQWTQGLTDIRPVGPGGSGLPEHLRRAAALERATATIAAEARKHPDLGPATSPVMEGADEVFWQNFGTRALYHHSRAGTHLLGGEILKAYVAMGGAVSSGLGAPTTSEVRDGPVVVAVAGQKVSVTPVAVHFTEGTISWSNAQGITVTRPQNSRCTLRWEFEIVQQRSGNDWHDEDWLCAVWMINGTAYPKAVPLTDRNSSGSRALHGRPENPSGRTAVAPLEDYVVCNRHDVVSVYYTVVNLSGAGYDAQLQKANEVTADAVRWLVPRYLAVAKEVLGVAVPVAGAVLGIADGVFPGYREGIGSFLADAWTHVGAPAVERVVNEVTIAFGSHANCSGPVLHDYVIVAPKAVNTVIDKTYTESRATHCQTPETRVRLTMTRTV